VAEISLLSRDDAFRERNAANREFINNIYPTEQRALNSYFYLMISFCQAASLTELRALNVFTNGSHYILP
jgi:hypothetical protein